MRTNIVIDAELVRQATMLTGATTKRELVNMALLELIKSKRKKNLFELAGKINFAEDYDHKANRELRNGAV